MVLVCTHAYCIFAGGRGIDTFLIQNGKKTYKHTDPNDCPSGTDIWVPRTKEMLQAVVAHYGNVAQQVVGIYGVYDGCGGCTSQAMNSGSAAQAAHWTSVGPSTGAPAEPFSGGGIRAASLSRGVVCPQRARRCDREL